MRSSPTDAGGAWTLLRPYLDRRPWLIISDFDGTLAPLTADPWGAAMVPAARRALRRLAGLPEITVALLSGRTGRDLAGRARIGGSLYLGNHGIERGRLARGARPTSLLTVRQAGLDGFDERAAWLADRVPEAVPEPWLIVERKGPAVTFHYRAASNVAAAGRRVRAAVETLDPAADFVRLPGRRALELRPPGAVSKATAVVDLLVELRPRLAILLGDDSSDADAFVALRTAAAPASDGSSGPGSAGRRPLVGVSFAVRHPAEPLPEVEAAADGVLTDPAAAARLLGALARSASAWALVDR